MFSIDSESEAAGSELRKRKDATAVESDANEIETIAEPMAKPDEPASDDVGVKEGETSETVKTHIDKKNE